MTSAAHRLATPIPQRMQSLPRDKRGYPIPVIVLRDAEGTPHFTINDSIVAERIRVNRLCSICGERLYNNIWFVGGPQASFHPKGAYIDGPVHRDCGHYALKVCPYLAVSGWTKRISDQQIKKVATPDGAFRVFQANTMIKDQPVVFVFGRARDYSSRAASKLTHWYYAERPWREVEFWRAGERIASDEAYALASVDPVVIPRLGELKWQAA